MVDPASWSPVSVRLPVVQSQPDHEPLLSQVETVCSLFNLVVKRHVLTMLFDRLWNGETETGLNIGPNGSVSMSCRIGDEAGARYLRLQLVVHEEDHAPRIFSTVTVHVIAPEGDSEVVACAALEVGVPRLSDREIWASTVAILHDLGFPDTIEDSRLWNGRFDGAPSGTGQTGEMIYRLDNGVAIELAARNR